MKAIIQQFRQKANSLQDVALLFLRLVLAYGFLNPALMKWGNLQGIAEWFESMNYPMPFVSALLAAMTEGLGVILLTLGLGTRLISLPLIFTMFVAIFTVHWGNGFQAGDNGFEIPLYYLLMLFALLAYGSGRISLDYVLERRCCRS